jgi:hypothetical protein
VNTRQVPKIPDGRYAVIDRDQKMKFVRVNTPDQGKWRGYTFVEVQASDDFHKIRNRDTRDAILFAIHEQGIQKCQIMYGQMIGVCGVCGRTLTDDVSRSKGIGPICEAKKGWA